ncbi:MAG: TlpA disulfide reductase family protein [Cellulophaga sp.]
MKFKIYWIFPIIAVILLQSCKIETKKKEVENKGEISLTEEALYEDLQGNTVKLSDYKGKRIVVNFWATWCVSCIKEMPSMVRAIKILEADNYKFLLVSDESVAKIEKFKAFKKFDFTYLKYNGAVSSEGIYALPTTFIYNEKGEKVDEIVGALTWDSEEIITRLKNIQ